MALTEKQEAFCNAYIESGNKNEAYRQAYDASVMNSNSVNVAAQELFKNPIITLRIEELQAEIRERNRIKIDDVIGILADMIRFDISELYDENDNLKSIHDIPKSHRQMISSVKSDHLYSGKEIIGETKEIKTLNKLDVIEKFMKHLGAYKEDNNQKTQSQVTIFQLPDNGRK
jgi:phage terminase small subunit